ncbi:glucosamine-6-phosphate deaminase [Mycoplasmoides fastidiosum]|uniref:Glucosamine-6-phosphate deaminase n=1 Tax=Mycoplasmoides fastidiosum TaxID=92758 RepID=A0ABU0LZW1_9BACT|nr:glucosamine-6-phosphate deaminase [Mycoplasmoides fastidiosum]MDQ0514241.1 glucosamine-6-phosphate deaminase [Mycoplasmoides fastidiosum]UUD37351.1 glucosamine-6-phosphate deaminase [Mycoplasmoides fastidiosum]
MHFKTKIYSNPKDASFYVAEQILKQINQKPDTVLGLATGSTPEQTYAELVKFYQAKKISFSQVTTFNLDEYYQLDPNNEQSYHTFMNHHLFSKIDIRNGNTHFPNEKQNYDHLIKKTGGIDLQILGIGTNGHIGFNEPGTNPDSWTRIVNLTPNTIKDNSRYFDSIDLVPKKAISMGLASIMKAKKIILIAFGSHKKAIMQKLLQQTTFDPELPASILTSHPDVEIVMDEAAAL